MTRSPGSPTWVGVHRVAYVGFRRAVVRLLTRPDDAPPVIVKARSIAVGRVHHHDGPRHSSSVARSASTSGRILHPRKARPSHPSHVMTVGNPTRELGCSTLPSVCGCRSAGVSGVDQYLPCWCRVDCGMGFRHDIRRAGWRVLTGRPSLARWAIRRKPPGVGVSMSTMRWCTSIPGS